MTLTEFVVQTIFITIPLAALTAFIAQTIFDKLQGRK